MVVTRLVGGLGNQMFQYAAGRALAARLVAPLRLDRRAFAGYKLHAYGLHHFALEESSDARLQELPDSRVSLFERLFDRHTQKIKPRIVRERGFAFDPGILTLPDNVYLDGYWQSERYFADAVATLRRDFTIVTPPSPQNAEWLARIQSELSVSMHVRRGDYVKDRQVNSVHGICTIDYYERAAHMLAERFGPELVFYVFSDDPEWVAQNLRLDYSMVYVRHNNAATNYEDLRLMSFCRHHVIANSTFGWWGAWLNGSAEKLVIAPKKWFQTDELDTKDLIPSSWRRI